MACGEPTFLKSGSRRKSHFAHFKGTAPSQVEECNFRVSVYGNSIKGGKINFVEDRGQRLEIFQKNSLDMISSSLNTIIGNPEFNNVTWIDPLKLNIITKACIDFFLSNKRAMAEKYGISPRTMYKTGSMTESEIQKEIALEAMDYLCKKSSRSLLEYLIHYSIYDLSKKSVCFDCKPIN